MWSPSFCFDDTRPTEIYPLSLHDALPILRLARAGAPWRTVIGVAGDVRERFDVREAWYLPYAQNASSPPDRKSTRLNSSHEWISYAVFCLKKKKLTRSREATPQDVEGHIS